MAWLAAIKAAIAVGREVYRFIREVETQGKARLSPEAMTRERRRFERLALWAYDGKDAGIRQYMTIDDAVPQAIQTFLKSSNLGYLIHGDEEKQKQAREAILKGADFLPETQAGPGIDRASP